MATTDLDDAILLENGKLRVRDYLPEDYIYTQNNLYLKHFLDRAFSGILILLLAPLFALSGLAILLEGLVSKSSRGPILITQERYSAGRRFKMLKFRSFLVQHDGLKQTTADAEWAINERRQTRVGKYLRTFYLDELPQLLNVLKGEMSLVGPRPWPQKQYQELVAKGYQAKRLLRGGLCGPTQAAKGQPHEYKNRLEMEEVLVRSYLARSALGVVALDARIIKDTAQVVLRGQGL